MKKLSVKIISILLAAVMLLTGCGNSTTSGKAEAPAADDGLKELVFGVSAPLTGSYSKIGLETKDAVTLALEEINYQIGDYKLVPVWIDDQGDPQAGVKAYEQAVVSDGIQCSLFCNFSSVAIAEMEIAAKYRIPHFVSWGSSATVDEKFATDSKYQVWLKAFAQPTKLSVSYLDALEGMIAEGIWNPSSKKFYIYGEDTDWGRAVADGMGVKFEEAGWECVGTDFFATGTTDFYSLLTKMKESGAVVLLGTIPSAASAAAFVKQAREINVPAVIVCEAISETGDIYKLCGEAINGVVDCRSAYLVDKEAGAAFNQKFYDRFGYETTAANGGYNYDCFQYWLSIVEETDKLYGDVNAETLLKFSIEEIQTGNYVWDEGMVMPALKYSPETIPDPVVGLDAFYNPALQYSGGAEGGFRPIYPLEAAEAEFIVPEYAQ